MERIANEMIPPLFLMSSGLIIPMLTIVPGGKPLNVPLGKVTVPTTLPSVSVIRYRSWTIGEGLVEVMDSRLEIVLVLDTVRAGDGDSRIEREAFSEKVVEDDPATEASERAKLAVFVFLSGGDCRRGGNTDEVDDSDLEADAVKVGEKVSEVLNVSDGEPVTDGRELSESVCEAEIDSVTEAESERDAVIESEDVEDTESVELCDEDSEPLPVSDDDSVLERDGVAE
jgi:hypothetical protein